MAEHTREEWLAVEDAYGGRWVVMSSKSCVAKYLEKERARQIAREHNAHPGLVAACKAALERLETGGPILGLEHSVARAILRDAIADAERKGEA